jgi:hypothetical protein
LIPHHQDTLAVRASDLQLAGVHGVTFKIWYNTITPLGGMVDTRDLKSLAMMRVGSSPTAGTNNFVGAVDNSYFALGAGNMGASPIGPTIYRAIV